MKTLTAAVMALALLGAAVATATAQSKGSQAATTRAKVFAEPG